MASIKDQINKKDPVSQRNALMQKIQGDYGIHGKYRMSKAAHKNIMIIGRTRTGKSTIKTLLVDPTRVSDEQTLKSGTRDPLFESFHVQDKSLVLNIIDTPGLFERSNDHVDIRDNETIMRTIHMCVNMEITKFHVIGFCIALTSGINTEDIKSLELLIKYLGQDLTNNSCLIITHCESKTAEQRKALENELVRDTFFQTLASFFKLGIYFSGSLNRDDYNQGNDNLLHQYVTVCEYREQLITLFMKEIDPFPVCEMLMNRMSSTHENLNTVTQQLANERNDEHTRLINELKNTQAQDQTRIEALLQRYRESVAREEKAIADSKHYMEGYENLLLHFQKDKPQRKVRINQAQ